MKAPIPNLGEYKPKKGKKMIYCGIAGKLFETHPYIKFSDIDKGLGYPEYHYDELGLFLTKKDYKRLNVRDNGIPWSIPDVPSEVTDKYDFEVQEKGWTNEGEKCRFTKYGKTEGWDDCGLERAYIASGYKNHFFIKLTPKPEPKERDLSGVQHILELFTPEVRDRVIKLANDPEDKHFQMFPKPLEFSKIFVWRPEKHRYWSQIDDAIIKADFRKGNPAFIQVFEWVKDRLPTEEDADGNGKVAFYDDMFSRNWSPEDWDCAHFKPVVPWSPTSETKQFTSKNPAPSPFEQ